MIIAVDFDGVLSSAGKWPEVGEALESAVAQCREHGLEFDAVNDNIPEIVEKYGVNSRKITADYYIDDKAVVVKFEKGKEHE